MGIKIHDLRNSFLYQIEILPSVEEEQLRKLARKFSKDLAPYREQLIELFLPEVIKPPEDKALQSTGGDK
jgi:hypothetical protein